MWQPHCMAYDRYSALRSEIMWPWRSSKTLAFLQYRIHNLPTFDVVSGQIEAEVVKCEQYKETDLVSDSRAILTDDTSKK